MSTRKLRLVDCNPRWISGRYTGVDSDVPRGIHFDCPEGHEGCSHTIPFTPALDGTASTSIRRVPTYANLEAAMAAGAVAEYLGDQHYCAFHGFIRDGRIEFCGDSR